MQVKRALRPGDSTSLLQALPSGDRLHLARKTLGDSEQGSVLVSPVGENLIVGTPGSHLCQALGSGRDLRRHGEMTLKKRVSFVEKNRVGGAILLLPVISF